MSLHFVRSDSLSCVKVIVIVRQQIRDNMSNTREKSTFYCRRINSFYAGVLHTAIVTTKRCICILQSELNSAFCNRVLRSRWPHYPSQYCSNTALKYVYNGPDNSHSNRNEE